MNHRIDRALSPAPLVALDEQNRQIPATMPDFGEHADSDTESPLDLAADMLATIFARIIPGEGPLRLELIGQKFVALHFLLNRSGTATLTEMAGRAGISKQLLDHHAQRVGRDLGFHGANQKKESASESYSAAARASWATLTPEQRKARRMGKATAPAAQDATPAA